MFVSAFLFVFKLGDESLSNMEARDAQIAREMYESGNWVIPTWNDEPLPWKPPAYDWCAIMSYHVFGGVSEFSARFPSAVMGIIGVIAVFVFGTLVFSRWTGFFGGLILAVNPEYFEHARKAQTDIYLCVYTTLALMFFFIGYFRHQQSISEESDIKISGAKTWGFKVFYLVCYFFMGWATIAKGPAGVVVPALVIFIYLVVQGNLRYLRQMAIPYGILVFLATTAIWYGPAWYIGGNDFMIELVWRQSFLRYMDAFDHVRPFWKYVQYLATNFLPWALFLPAAIGFVFTGGHTREKRRKYVFLFIWFAIVFLFYSVSQSKRSVYILALYPAVSLMVGRLFDVAIKRPEMRKLQKNMAITSIVFAAVYSLLAFVLIFVAINGNDILSGNSYKWISSSGKQAMPELIATLVYNKGTIFLLAFVMLAGSVLAVYGFVKKHATIAINAIFASTILVFISYMLIFTPVLDRYQDLRPFCGTIDQYVKQGATLAFYNKGETRRQTVVFYYGKPIRMLIPETIGVPNPGTIREDDIDILLQFLKDEKAPMVVIRRDVLEEIIKSTDVKLVVVEESGLAEVGYLCLVTKAK